jgi:simple sugar transport system substrate-binding protein
MRRLLVLVVLALAGCGGTTVVREQGVTVSGSPTSAPVPGAPVPDGAVRIAVVTHGPASSKF